MAGAHTDVGKTHVACALIRAARRRGLAVAALKPVVSGFDPDDWTGSDPGRLLAALGKPATPAELDALSPWRFAAPLAPPMAARREGVRLELATLTARAGQWLQATAGEDLRVVEGVGGLMSPVAEDATGLDLMAALGLPAVLVGGAYLGAISHTLTALEVLRARALPVVAVVVSQGGGADAPDFGETVEAVRAFAGPTPVVAAPRGGDEHGSDEHGGEEPWAEVLLDLAGKMSPAA